MTAWQVSQRYMTKGKTFPEVIYTDTLFSDRDRASQIVESLNESRVDPTVEEWFLRQVDVHTGKV